MKIRVLLTSVLLILAAGAHAIEPLHKERTLSIHHSTAKVTTERVDGQVLDTVRLADEMNFDLRPDESVRIVVDDQNPLVYTYAWKGVVRTKTADYDEALKFVDTLNTLQTAFTTLLTPLTVETRQSESLDAQG
ncbi:MAG: hypothetical protein ACTHQM_02020, partial [Thermoanaerobaculia bacterium]